MFGHLLLVKEPVSNKFNYKRVLVGGSVSNLYDDKSMFIYTNIKRTLLGVVVGEQVCVDVGVGGAGLADAGPGPGSAVGDDVGLLRLTALFCHIEGDLAQDVNIVIGVFHSDTAK